MQRTRCFLEKFTQLEKILHDHRSRRSWQISSLPHVSRNLMWWWWFLLSWQLLLNIWLYLRGILWIEMGKDLFLLPSMFWLIPLIYKTFYFKHTWMRYPYPSKDKLIIFYKKTHGKICLGLEEKMYGWWYGTQLAKRSLIQSQELITGEKDHMWDTWEKSYERQHQKNSCWFYLFEVFFLSGGQKQALWSSHQLTGSLSTTSPGRTNITKKERDRKGLKIIKLPISDGKRNSKLSAATSQLFSWGTRLIFSPR